MPRQSFFFSVFLLLLFPFGGKKEKILALSKKYFPANYVVLNEADERFISGLTHGDFSEEGLDDVATVVHECYHHYLGVHSSYFDTAMVYRINDTLSFSVRTFKTFPSIELNNLVPKEIQNKIFRYETYINSNEASLVTQQFGILGLIEEACAYYQSIQTDLGLYNYFVDNNGWKDPKPWTSWFSYMGSYRYSLTEFELFISWYLQYAKKKYPAIYASINANNGLKKIIRFLHNENVRLAALYDARRATILENMRGKLEIRGNFVYDIKKNTGKGLSDNELNDMNTLLAAPEHDLYRSFLR